MAGVAAGIGLLRDKYMGRGCGKVVRLFGIGTAKSRLDACTTCGLSAKRAYCSQNMK